ncbi:MAG: DUF421 domain-containing protein [Chloroflexi bacterium]|nr:DUF421 domain-containing protein [Chloroflexota bacterium]
MFDLTVSIPELIARAALIYLALLVAFRAFGKREVGQFTLYDLVFVLLVANAVQPAVTGPDNSALGGVVVILTLAVLNFAVSRVHFLQHLLVSPPTVLVRDGAFQEEAMEKEGVDQEEVETAMREHGVDDMKHVKLAVLEPDGDISIVEKDGSGGRRRRRRRYKRRS